MWVLERVRNRERENSPKDFFILRYVTILKRAL